MQVSGACRKVIERIIIMKLMQCILLAVLPAVFSSADVLLNETFESGLGSALASNLTTVTSGSGAIGPDSVADLNDNSGADLLRGPCMFHLIC
jgi:hypothetical protein